MAVAERRYERKTQPIGSVEEQESTSFDTGWNLLGWIRWDAIPRNK